VLLTPDSFRQRRSSRTAVFVDTSAYVALTDPSDVNNVEAKRVLQRVEKGVWRFVTTNFVLAETHARLLQTKNRVIALDFLTNVESSDITDVLNVGDDVQQRARELLRRFNDKSYSLCDCLSFATTEVFGITRAWAYDHHFTQYGKLHVLQADDQSW
jgi:predicted nucleic acid-binding protein